MNSSVETRIRIDRLASRVAVVTMNSPGDLNALGVEMSAALRAAFREVADDDQVRVVVLKGAGRAFSSGGDLKQMSDSLAVDPGVYMDALTEQVYRLVESALALEKPLIAAVHGFAYGAAFNLVLACDMVLAASGARFCQSFIRLGLIPGGYATILLPAIVGEKRAFELCATGRDMAADEALDLGIVNQVVPADELESTTLELAGQLSAGPARALRETKRLLKSARVKPMGEQAVIERRTQVEMARTTDFAEGVTAFLEKRKPRFRS